MRHGLRHIGAEQGRGPCVACGATGDGFCSRRMRVATSDGPRDRYDAVRGVAYRMDRERPVPRGQGLALSVDDSGARPDGWG